MKIISEIQVIPVKPNNGLIAFCSFVLFEAIYCSSVAIFTKPDRDYRLVYPTKHIGNRDMNLFHPINKQTGSLIEEEVNNYLKNVMNNDRYNFTDN
ncbi:septation protein SpoVG family protein [Candidatus Dojkabacteria bacterium]|nr:septation protein SpoVG family protein [Candidatus Dojkabacteria bacterium]